VFEILKQDGEEALRSEDVTGWHHTPMSECQRSSEALDLASLGKFVHEDLTVHKCGPSSSRKTGQSILWFGSIPQGSLQEFQPIIQFEPQFPSLLFGLQQLDIPGLNKICQCLSNGIRLIRVNVQPTHSIHG
jgi:hypothetical protein